MKHGKAQKYMGIAVAVAELSKDVSTKVGAVVVGDTNEIRSVGYNGAPRGSRADEPEDIRGERPEKYYWAAHAELNSITNAARVGIPLAGSTIYVTHFPCMDCAKAIVQSGITRVVTYEPDKAFFERWKEHITRSRQLFRECNVEVVYIV